MVVGFREKWREWEKFAWKSVEMIKKRVVCWIGICRFDGWLWGVGFHVWNKKARRVGSWNFNIIKIEKVVLRFVQGFINFFYKTKFVCAFLYIYLCVRMYVYAWYVYVSMITYILHFFYCFIYIYIHWNQ